MDVIFGLLGQLEWWRYIIITLVFTHLTIISVTLYLHRSKTHGSVEFNHLIQHFFRFWLWLTTGMKTSEWVKVHRKHHATCETVDDPHSPKYYGIWKLLFGGVGLYKKAVVSPNIDFYVSGELSKGLPNDWIEHNVYSKYPWLGLVILVILQFTFLGLPGLVIFGIQAYWIPIMAAGVINGIGHYWGYRNFETPDHSRNIFPWGIVIGGEELHNNHHANQTSPKLSVKPWEFDICWMYIRILEYLNLAKFDPKKVATLPVFVPCDNLLDKNDLLELFRKHSYYISIEFNKSIEGGVADNSLSSLINTFKSWLEAPNSVSADELEGWVGSVNKFVFDKSFEAKEDCGNRLFSFASWFRSLH